jgi:hypothetical protein
MSRLKLLQMENQWSGLLSYLLLLLPENTSTFWDTLYDQLHKEGICLVHKWRHQSEIDCWCITGPLMYWYKEQQWEKQKPLISFNMEREVAWDKSKDCLLSCDEWLENLTNRLKCICLYSVDRLKKGAHMNWPFSHFSDCQRTFTEGGSHNLVEGKAHLIHVKHPLSWPSMEKSMQ